MNIEELKNAWDTYDKNLNSKINLDLLKEVTINKTKSLTHTFKFSVIVEVVVSLFFVNYMVEVVIEHWATWEYSLPALVIGLISLGTVIWNVYALIQLAFLNYDASITEAQKKMERIYRQSKWQNTTLHYLLVPLAGAMMAIMALKYLNLPLTGHLDIILYAVLGCIAVVPMVVWIVKMTPDKEMESAIRFLDDIKKFEKEEEESHSTLK
jgi:hypothetical protein